MNKNVTNILLTAYKKILSPFYVYTYIYVEILMWSGRCPTLIRISTNILNRIRHMFTNNRRNLQNQNQGRSSIFGGPA